MYSTSCVTNHYGVTISEFLEWFSQERNMIFPGNKIILKLRIKYYIFKSYHFLAEVTLKLRGGNKTWRTPR